MSRPLRIEFPGAIYHAMGRGINKADVFLDDRDRMRFLDLLYEQVKEGFLIIHAFCLMGNHFHLLAETPNVGFGRIMQKILSCYSRWFNIRHGRVGRLWQDRYRAILVEDGEYFLECSRYIHLNPEKKQRPERADQYKWSSYRNYLGKESVVDWISKEKTLSFFEKERDYFEFVNAKRSIEVENPFEKAEAGLIFGGKRFVERLKRFIEERDNGNEGDIPMLQQLRRANHSYSFEETERAVRSACKGLSDCQLRRILIYALHKFTALKGIEIAELTGRSSSSVSRTVRALEKRTKVDPTINEMIMKVHKKLSSLVKVFHLAEEI